MARAADQTLTLKRAVLSTGGVGYFEYEPTVGGDQTLHFDVRLDQDDDVLKSLGVFDGSALQSPATLLRALTGSEITIEGPSRVSGRVLNVAPEVVQLEDGATITRHRLTVTGDDGLTQTILEDADEVEFADAELEEQIAGALAE